MTQSQADDLSIATKLCLTIRFVAVRFSSIIQLLPLLMLNLMKDAV